MSKRRIVVTGMGICSPLGGEPKSFYQSLLEGKSAVGLVDRFDVSSFSTRFAAQVKGVDFERHLNPKQMRRLDPVIRYALYAGKEAARDAGLASESSSEERWGVIIGSGMGGMDMFFDSSLKLSQQGCKRVSPFFVPYTITNMAGALLAQEFGCRGPNYSISTACASANNCFIAAASHIRSGECDLLFCGGTEAALSPMGMAGFSACKALSKRNEEPQKASRPWDKNRDGFVLGEGAAVLVFEELEHAKRRGAKIYAEYLGGGLSCDAHHITDPLPSGEGASLCMKKALDDAGVSPQEVDHINAHATSTPVGDLAELQSIAALFPPSAELVINATKSMIGHSLGAAGAMEAIAIIGAIQEGFVHPTLNLEEPEDILSLYNFPRQKLAHRVDIALSNSFGFGGHNASVIFSRFEESKD